jgi:hypothetical protein
VPAGEADAGLHRRGVQLRAAHVEIENIHVQMGQTEVRQQSLETGHPNTLAVDRHMT